MQQRLQLATALMGDPDVIILDEPFAGLDPVAVADLSTVLADRVDAGCTVLFSSHHVNGQPKVPAGEPVAETASMMAKGHDTQVDDFRTRPLDAGPYPFIAADAHAGPLVVRAKASATVDVPPDPTDQ